MINAELLRTCEEVYDRVNQYEVETGKSLGRHQLAISKAPREYWQKLTELLIENKWSVRDTEAIVDAVNKMMALQCPDWLTEIVKFLLWLEEQTVHVDGLLNPEVNLTRHLYAISRSPSQYWQQLTELLIENEWSVRQTR